jgi:Uma2 family endonuclease
MEAPATIRAPKAVMWTREDCRRLEAAGLLPARWELVQGEIVSKMGINRPHSMIASSILAWLISEFSSRHVLPTCSIDVAPEDNPTSEPEPDITILRLPAAELHRNPVPGDIVLLVEVSDTTLEFDLGPKAHLYARAGIKEYWVADINTRRIYQHREPGLQGYASVRVFAGTETLSPLAKPEATLPLAEIFE